jgi:hypothetical protein
VEPAAQHHDDLSDLLEQLLDGPTALCPERLAAGRRRAAGGPVPAEDLADALVAEARRAQEAALGADVRI